MLKKNLSLVLVVLLTNVLMSVPALARSANKSQDTVEKIKIKIVKLGVGEKARATVHLKDGTKIKGYITQAGDNDFVIRDRKTNEPRTVSYQDVAKVDSNKGHSIRNIAIGIAVGVGATLAVLALIIANLD